MSALDDIRAIRIAKIKKLEAAGMPAYPADTKQTHSIKDIATSFDTLSANASVVTLVGRVLSLRAQGALIFVDLNDGTGKVQALLKQGEIAENLFTLFQDTVDMGDFVEVSGTLFTTKRGEKTVAVKTWRMLTKSVRPLPDEWYGIKDEDERYRKRYLDILLNEDVADIVRKRSVFWNTMRTFLLERNFIEVDTPVLENVTGGADARPFVTHHNALDIDVYLRISAGELWQKKLLVAGLPRVFEIGRIFRNEGMSAEHLQDYTQMEFYQAYSDFREGMKMITELYREIAEKTFGTTKFSIKDFTIDLAGEWQMYDYCALIKEHFGIDPLVANIEEVKAKIKEAEIEHDDKTINLERGVDLLWKKIRRSLSGPGFLINVPAYLEPLAKRSKEDSRVVERFQILLAGSEMGKGFSELNDPLDQRERFLQQQALRDAGDEEAQMADMEFVEALEFGMPPAFGFGVSERLFSFLLNKSVREGQIFPLMRPKEGSN